MKSDTGGSSKRGNIINSLENLQEQILGILRQLNPSRQYPVMIGDILEKLGEEKPRDILEAIFLLEKQKLIEVDYLRNFDIEIIKVF